MIRDVARIKRYLAWRYELPLADAENDLFVRVTEPVPDGEHVIPLGPNGETYLVKIKDDQLDGIRACKVTVSVG